jgi:hypothetical protein
MDTSLQIGSSFNLHAVKNKYRSRIWRLFSEACALVGDGRLKISH